MAIEKAFAINASPDAIYAAIERDLAGAAEFSGKTFEVLRRDPGRSIDLRVTLGGIPCWLTYRLEPKEGFTEVVAKLTPFGFRYVLFTVATLGMRQHSLALTLVQGLANLKEAVEKDAGAAPGAPAGL